MHLNTVSIFFFNFLREDSHKDLCRKVHTFKSNILVVLNLAQNCFKIQ